MKHSMNLLILAIAAYFVLRDCWAKVQLNSARIDNLATAVHLAKNVS